MTDLYTPTDLTAKQTRLIIRLSERYGVGSCFMPSRARATVTDLETLKRAGYVERLGGVQTYYYRLTEKCESLINANN